MMQTLGDPRLQHVEDLVRLGRLRTHMHPEQDQFLVAKGRIVISNIRIFRSLVIYKCQEK